MSDKEKESATGSTCPAVDDSDLQLRESAAVGWRTWLAVFASCFCPFIGYWITVHTAFFYSTPSTALGAGSAGVWLPTAFSIVNASANSCLAQLAEIYGRKPVILTGFTLAFVGAIVIATAQDFRLLIVGSTLFGGCLANEGVFFAIPSEVLPRRYRGVGQCLFSLTGGLACTSCVLINGALIQAYPVDGWRYGYYLLAGLIAVACVALSLLYHPMPVKSTQHSTWTRLRIEVDWIGSILQCAWIVPIMVALNWGGSAYAWSSAHVIAMFAVGGVFLIIFAIHQTWYKKDGILHHGMFESRNLWLCLGGCFVEGLIFLVFNSQYPTMLSTIWNVTPFYQAVRFFPMYCIFGATSPLWGLWTKRFREYKVPLTTGWVLTIVAAALLATAGQGDVNVGIGAAFLAGAGLAAPFALLISCAQLGVPVELLGLVTSRCSSVRAIGIALSTTVSVTLYSSQLKSDLPKKVLAATTALGVSTADGQALAAAELAGTALPAGFSNAVLAAVQKAVIDARTTAFHVPWYWAIAWCVVAIGLVLGLDSAFIRKRMTWEVERPVQDGLKGGVIHHEDA